MSCCNNNENIRQFYSRLPGRSQVQQLFYERMDGLISCPNEDQNTEHWDTNSGGNSIHSFIHTFKHQIQLVLIHFHYPFKRYSTSKTLFVLRQKSCHKAAFSWSGGYNSRLQHKRLSRCDSFSAVADIAMIRIICSGWSCQEKWFAPVLSNGLPPTP